MESGGIFWNVTCEGSGRAIVLLHGWGQNQYMMKFIADHFRQDFQVVNLDLPGFGESDEPKTVWSIGDYAKALHQLLEDLQITQPILIAHSFGARIALRYALMFPVEKMILTGAAGIKAKRRISYYVRVYSYKLLKKLHVSTRMGSEDFQNASLIMKGVLCSCVNEDIQDELKNITCETLLVWGEYDTQTPLSMGKIMEEKIPNATLIVLKKQDHFAYFYQSQRFLRICEAFLYA